MNTHSADDNDHDRPPGGRTPDWVRGAISYRDGRAENWWGQMQNKVS